MNLNRFQRLARKHAALRIGVLGDYCLDRYLEIDPVRTETSIETNLPVYNVARVRAQPGGAGTIVNNLAALGVGQIYPIGFCGEDGEGYELRRALANHTAVRLDGFMQTKDRCTFTYCKPLVMESGKVPRELNRFDTKNWTATPSNVQEALAASLLEIAPRLDALILLDQVDIAETGVVTHGVLDAIERLVKERNGLLVVGDSRRGMHDWPPMLFKMNAAELASLTGISSESGISELKCMARSLAQRQKRPIVVTLADRGMIGALPEGAVEHVPAYPLRGPIDIVGAGDSVTANLAASMAAGATLLEAIAIASAAASIVIHQLGTTGVASCGCHLWFACIIEVR